MTMNRIRRRQEEIKQIKPAAMERGCMGMIVGIGGWEITIARILIIVASNAREVGAI
jgi:hypothetical protein